jgi:hypothetical protein
VTLFTRALDEFKTKARESKFLVRYEANVTGRLGIVYGLRGIRRQLNAWQG